MRIAIFTDTFPPQIDGVASVAYQSARELVNCGHEVFVFVPKHKQRESEILERTNGFKLIEIPSFPFWGYPGHRCALPLGTGLRNFYKKRMDLIHTHTPFTVGWEAVCAAKIFNVPIVGTHHTFYDHYLKHVKLDYPWVKKPSWKYIVGYYNRCGHVLSPTKRLADELIHHGLKTKISVMPNPIDTELFKPVKDIKTKKNLKNKFGLKGISLIYMGRVSYEKNIDKTIKAFALAQKTMPDLILMIVGDGPERKNLEDLTQKLGLKNSVIFTGFLHDNELLQVLQANDIFITASESENMPVSVLEAMASGLPVIGVTALGIPEIAKNELNGFLVAPGNIEEMSTQIIKLAKNKKLREKFSVNSRKIAMNFSRQAIIKSVENLYQNLIQR